MTKEARVIWEGASPDNSKHLLRIVAEMKAGYDSREIRAWKLIYEESFGKDAMGVQRWKAREGDGGESYLVGLIERKWDLFTKELQRLLDLTLEPKA